MSRQAGNDLLGILRGAQMVLNECLKVQENQAKHIWKNSSVRSAIADGSKSVATTFNSDKNDVMETLMSPKNRHLFMPSIEARIIFKESGTLNKKAAILLINFDFFFGRGRGKVQDYLNEAVQRASMITHGLKALVFSKEDINKDSVFSGNDYLIYDNMVLKPDDIEKLLEESYPHSESCDIRDMTKLKEESNTILSVQAEIQFGGEPQGIPTISISNLHSEIEKRVPLLVRNTGIDQPVMQIVGDWKDQKGTNESVHKVNNFVNLDKPTFVKTAVSSDNEKPVIKTVKFKQKLSDEARERKVPSTRLGRVISFGSLAAGLGIGTVAEVTRRTLGIAPSIGTTLDSAFLTPANAERIVNTLCKVRGAALKIGQLLSIQDNNVISPVLQQAFERVRQSADFMPQYQIKNVLELELGQDWLKHFNDFELKPFAAASIGQVHKAELTDGRLVAVKIQYPGVAQGINSDIDNLVSILNLWNMFPEGMFIDNIVEVAKRELAWEVDYDREAECTKKFKELLAPYPDYYIPDVVDHLSTRQIFTTELIDGVPVDKASEFDEATRKHVCKLIMDLCLKEIFQFRYMQTDPNWSNFFYNQETKKLILLDFGSSRSYQKTFIDEYIKVIKAAADGDRQKVLEMSRHMKFLTGFESKAMEEAHVDTVMILGEIFNESAGEFDFGHQDTTARVTRLVPTILNHRLCPPPEEIYSLHRKLSGVFLLCSKLNVKMACRPLFLRIYNNYNYD